MSCGCRGRCGRRRRPRAASASCPCACRPAAILTRQRRLQRCSPGSGRRLGLGEHFFDRMSCRIPLTILPLWSFHGHDVSAGSLLRSQATCFASDVRLCVLLGLIRLLELDKGKASKVRLYAVARVCQCRQPAYYNTGFACAVRQSPEGISCRGCRRNSRRLQTAVRRSCGAACTKQVRAARMSCMHLACAEHYMQSCLACEVHSAALASQAQRISRVGSWGAWQIPVPPLPETALC
jgi:hypothetical protein